MHTNPDVSTFGYGILNRGRPFKAEAISDDTFRVGLSKPVYGIVKGLSTMGPTRGIHPYHYLKKWHIDHNPEAEKVAKEEGFSTWYDALYNHFWWRPTTDLDRPTLEAWVLAENSSVQKKLVRNPYYYKVDPAGQQLPYIDEIISPIVSTEIYNLKIISGETDFALMHTSFENFTLYKENEESGDYVVHTVPGRTASQVSIVFNYHTPDPLLNQLTQDIKFKAGLSHAINRDEINRVVYKGMGVPRQATVSPSESYYKPGWAEAYAKYDVTLANRYLDEAGLTKKNADGFRLRPDNGEVLEWIVEFGGGGGGAMATDTVMVMELVKEYWEAVGVKTLTKSMERALFNEREHSGLIVSKVRSTMVDNHFNVGHWGTLWNQWIGADRQVRLGQKKLEDFKDSKLPGVEPPQWVKDYEGLFYSREHAEPNSPEWEAALSKAMDMQAQNLFLIGSVGLVPSVVIGKDYIHNLPTSIPP
jgi:peptide/nickel transport system substrate-binding protein